MGRRRAPTRPETVERAADELIEVLERLTAQGWDPYPVGTTERIGQSLRYGDLAVVLGDEIAITWNPAAHCWEPWSLEWDVDPDEEERRGRVG